MASAGLVLALKVVLGGGASLLVLLFAWRLFARWLGTPNADPDEVWARLFPDSDEAALLRERKQEELAFDLATKGYAVMRAFDRQCRARDARRGLLPGESGYVCSRPSLLPCKAFEIDPTGGSRRASGGGREGKGGRMCLLAECS